MHDPAIYVDDDWDGPECCQRCDGNGTILVCWDDLCQGQGYCIHGDGDELCPECGGTGEIYSSR